MVTYLQEEAREQYREQCRLRSIVWKAIEDIYGSPWEGPVCREELDKIVVEMMDVHERAERRKAERGW